ncbi:hypothetical protein AB1Y20_013717 [Prymnesium parvum]|uniref:Uncharacterized protein n=1 Tax=Prymnesium parvum TaxID=97485 RepID=A0AB34IGC6_PRYPA
MMALVASRYSRLLTGYFQYAPLTSAPVQVSIHGRRYLTQEQAVQLSPPSSIRAIVRTPRVWVDRRLFRLAFQLQDANGHPNVDTSAVNVEYIISRADGSSVNGTCDASSIVGFCADSSLPGTDSWFAGSGAVLAEIKVTLWVNSVLVASATLSSHLIFVPQPSWYKPGLRSSVSGNTLTIPSGAGIDSGGVFVTLPASNVYQSEAFDVFMYANTASFVLSSMTVELMYDASLLECALGCDASFETNSDFNAPAFLSTPGQLSFSITGVRDGTPNSATIGTAIFLLRVQLQFNPAVASGVYGSSVLGLYPRAETLANTGGLAFVSASRGVQRGVVFDRRDAVNSYGEMEVSSPVSRGIFAYMERPVLLNSALSSIFSEAAQAYTPVVLRVTSDSRYSDAWADSITPSSCEVGSPSTVALVLDGCSFTVNLTQSASDVPMNVSYTDGNTTFRASLTFGVFVPDSIVMTAEDLILNRIEDLHGTTVPQCSSGSRTRYPYQSTRLRATSSASSLPGAAPLAIDITSLVSFSVDAPGIASVGLDDDWNLLSGRSVGSAAVRLGSQSAPVLRSPILVVDVSNSPVSAVAMVSRVITDVTWSETPAFWFTFGSSVAAAVLVGQIFAAEGDSGLLYSTVTWSDGASEAVGIKAWAGLDEIAQPSFNPNIVVYAPLGESNSEQFWKVGVAVGAINECIVTVVVNWTVCGTTVATSTVPIHLNLPDPTEVQLSAADTRLTGANDDARLAPISLPVSTQLRVLVSFGDGTTKDMTTDTRVSYAVADARCAGMVGDIMVHTRDAARSAGCTAVVVNATVTLGAFTLISSISVPLVYLDRVELDFVGYPSNNAGVVLTKLYRVECLEATYQRAAPRLLAFLSDSSAAIDVTSAGVYASNNTQVISQSDSTSLVATGSGIALLTATFGTSPAIASAILVVDSAVAQVASIEWDVYGVTSGAERTLVEYVNSTRTTRTDVSFAPQAGQSGVVTYLDIAATHSSSMAWLDASAMVGYLSDASHIVSVDVFGTLTLRSNAHTSIGLEAYMRCAVATATEKSVTANLLPLELDVDAGARIGFQFQQESSNTLPIPLRVRGVASGAITAFGLSLYRYDPALLSSKRSDGASWSSSGLYSGTAAELDAVYGGFVGGLARVVGADSTSTQNGGSDGLEVGTLTLGVVGSGVTIVDVQIENLEIFEGSTKLIELQYVDAIAAVGYASVSAGRRSRRLVFSSGKTPTVVPSPQLVQQLLTRPLTAPLNWRRSRGLQSCDPCTSLVWGDFNGDCNFLPTDVSALQRIVLRRLSFVGGAGADPLDALDWTSFPSTACAEFIKLQGNPTRDVMAFGFGDPRYLSPAVDATDTQHLLSAFVKEYRLLAGLNASCVTAPDSESSDQDLRLTAWLVGGDGQNSATVGANPVYTDVFAELRVSPAPISYTVHVGSLVTSRDPANGFPDSARLSADQSGVLMQLEHVGEGYYVLQLRPHRSNESAVFEFEIALLVETRTPALVQSTPASFKPWLGASILPYTSSGFSFSSVWGGGSTARS